MVDDQVTIEVDGNEIPARKGAMLIEATDAAGIYVPRFCYHAKLSIAANCRMCLVEVEKAPKPLPACATPVTDGMKVKTRSPLALGAQRSTMEFLLINHPLDCPICDQGGECELQDLAVGYGNDVSRYNEGKRVVRDKDIGPLIQTDMTRCIHCTRCVRFGEEIAGVRELGATGRGEFTEIGTYVAHAVGSELSGNVIDLCPVGALTSRPFRFSARPWELRQFRAVAPHDSAGSNVYVHAKGRTIKRVVPCDNDAVNESWISDRDRYAYAGLGHEERLTAPMLRDGAGWREVDWDTALAAAAEGLKRTLAAHGADGVGMLASPNASLEELYLFARLARGLGVANVDHRLRQGDFSDDAEAPVAPWLGGALAELERADAVLLVGSNLRKDQPLINHRLRKAALAGARVALLDSMAYEWNFPLAARAVHAPAALPAALAGIARAALGDAGGPEAGLLSGVRPDDDQGAIANLLRGAKAGLVLLGAGAASHPQYSRLRWLAGTIARATGARLGYLPDGANGVGAWLAGAVPHRGPGGRKLERTGADARAMFETPRRGYVLMGVEPELDCWNPAAALKALRGAEFVLSLSAFAGAAAREYAHLLLPIAQFAETAGTWVNAGGLWQSAAQAVPAPGAARPAWKVLRVLANRCALPQFDYQGEDEVLGELQALVIDRTPALDGRWRVPTDAAAGADAAVERITLLSAYSSDPLVRRSAPLQCAADAADDAVRVNAALAARLGLATGDRVLVEQAGVRTEATAVVDSTVPDGCAALYAARPPATALGPWHGRLTLTRAGA